MLNLLFVYGTLRSGCENPYARLLRSEAELVGRATMRGSIYRVRRHPAYKSEPDGEVHGEIYRLQNPEMTLRVLDDYEGKDFERILVDSAQPEGASCAIQSCWIYRYLPDPPEHLRILSGDFLAE